MAENVNKKEKQRKSGKGLGASLISIGVVGILMILIYGEILHFPHDGVFIRYWVAGAGALGLLGGFTTGASEAPGSGTGFVTFLGAGLLVPIIGGAASLLSVTTTVIESSTYSGDNLIEKITTTINSYDESLNPIGLIGSFFVVFALFAMLGMVGGVLLRGKGTEDEGFVIKNIISNR